MMNVHNFDTTLYVGRIRTPPPSMLLLPHYRNSPSVDLRSRQQKSHHDITSPSFGWRRYSDKTIQLNPAPDIAYRNTYLEGIQREKSDINNNEQIHSRSSTPYLKVQNLYSYHLPSELSQQKYHSQQQHTVYDYIRDSIRQYEQQRNLKRNMSLHIKRPQNEDNTLQHILSKRKISASRNNLTETTSSFSNYGLKRSQTVVNYINHIRAVHSKTTLNQSHR
ncbi:unnamed protein product [Adineta steineri]|uniref:Uncharacterized protein n=1 Tax=Adineta steineri TaxID=433720 RepID=A0A815RQ30_9BILA|nr:unnamed protein product [Adineta steineri]CAF1478007.1 unnamed protein product [Adineta steineri]